VTTVQQGFSARVLGEHAARRAALPTVTGEPGGLPATFEDPSLPHQIMLLVPSSAAHTGRIAVSCNCLARPSGPGAGRGRPREIIESRTEFPAADVIAAYHAWHGERGIEVRP
jgi:hypothetical protein